jgi:hypothetical protein
VDTKKILSDLRAELARINQAIAALETLSDTGVPTVAKAAGPKPRRRRISAAGRRRISEAAKARWAERRKKATKPVAPKQAGGRGKMSPAARKRISEMMKKRWAERRKKAAKVA